MKFFNPRRLTFFPRSRLINVIEEVQYEGVHLWVVCCADPNNSSDRVHISNTNPKHAVLNLFQQLRNRFHMGSDMEKWKVYTIAILGKQQIGKSTLLGDLFSLNFRTGDGTSRTSRGITIGMVPIVDEEISLILMDVEGILSSERRGAAKALDRAASEISNVYFGEAIAQEMRLCLNAILSSDILLVYVNAKPLGSDDKDPIASLLNAYLVIWETNPEKFCRQFLFVFRSPQNFTTAKKSLRPKLVREFLN